MMQQAEIGFETMLGSSEAATSFLDDLKDFAAATPFELPGLIKAAQSLVAVGFEAKEVRPILTSVGDAVSGLGGTAEDVNRLVGVLGKMKSVGKATGDTMTSVAEMGIPAWQFLAETLGTDVKGAMAAVSAGTVDADVAIGALTKGMDGKFGGLMAKQSRSMAGLISTVKDTWAQVSGAISKPLFDAVANALGGFADFLSSDSFKGAIKLAANALTQFFALFQGDATSKMAAWEKLRGIFGAPVADTIGRIAMTLVGLFEAFTGGAGASERLKDALGGLFGAEAGGAITAVITTMSKAWSGMLNLLGSNPKSTITAISAVVAAIMVPALVLATTAVWGLMAPILPLIALIALIGVAAFALSMAWENNFFGIRDVTTEVAGAIMQVLGPAFDFLKIGFAEIWKVAEPILGAMFGELAKFWEEIAPKLEKFIAGVVRNFTTQLDLAGRGVAMVVGFIRDNWESIGPVFTGVFKVIGAVATTFWDLLTGLFSAGLSLVTGDWDGFITGMQETFGQYVEDLLKLGKSFWDLLVATFRLGVDLVAGIFAGLIAKAVDVKNWFVGNVFGLTETITNTIRDTLIGALQWLKDKGSEIRSWFTGNAFALTETITSTIRDTIIGALQWLQEKGESVKGWFGGAPFALVETITNTIRDTLIGAFTWVQSKAAEVKDWLDRNVFSMGQNISGAGGGAALAWESFSAVLGKASELKSWLDARTFSIKEAISGPMGTAWDAVNDVIKRLVDLWNYITTRTFTVSSVFTFPSVPAPGASGGGGSGAASLSSFSDGGFRAASIGGGSGGVNVYITVLGSVTAERDLAVTIRDELLRIERRNTSLGFA